MADAIFTALLNTTCTTRRYATGAQSATTGMTAKTWGDQDTDVPCRREDTMGSGSTMGKEVFVDKQAVIARFLFFFEDDVDITEADRITAVAGGTETYEVVLVLSPGGGGHHKEVWANETKV